MRTRWAAAGTALVVAPLLAAPAAPAGAAEPVCVAVTVDYRNLAGAPGSPSTFCAKVPNRSTGFEILVARARALGRPQPRSEGGLICAIDGLPERGCGESVDGGYRYWAYFHRMADGPWQYSNRGAGDYRVIDDPNRTDDNSPGEGWVWVDGGAEGAVKPAQVPYERTCPPSAKPSPTRSPAVRPSSPPAPRPSADAPKPSTPTSAPAPAPTGGRGAASVTAGRSPEPGGSPTAAGSASGAGTPAAAATDNPGTPLPAPVSTAAETIGLATEPDGGGVPVSTAIGVAAIAVIAAGALLRRRRDGIG